MCIYISVSQVCAANVFYSSVTFICTLRIVSSVIHKFEIFVYLSVVIFKIHAFMVCFSVLLSDLPWIWLCVWREGGIRLYFVPVDSQLSPCHSLTHVSTVCV